MPDLKNLRQIGSPTNTDKIYMENSAYQRIHREEFPDRRVFVLMGHTECAPGGYTTFVEAVIPVWDIAFMHGVPVWNSHVWSTVFGVVKRNFQDSVIIGWVLDLKGMPPRLTPEVEAVHREHFGGAHQLLLLMDTLEQEECFYQNRSGNFYPKEGFYIYFDPKSAGAEPETMRSEARSLEGRKEVGAEPETMQSEDHSEEGRGEASVVFEEQTRPPRARYRENVYGTGKKEQNTSGKWFSSAAVIAAILLLFAIIGTGIRQGRFSLEEIEQTVESLSTKVIPQTEEADTETSAEPQDKTQTEDVSALLKAMEETAEDAGIVVEEVPQGDIEN